MYDLLDVKVNIIRAGEAGTSATNTDAICGHAICGQTICGGEA